ncbi:MAG TPA: CHAT domain-containing protein, partial [Pirellulaceae bacterium]|nr:CHAT domain-containing protein [Pirellulaceae bacterium]
MAAESIDLELQFEWREDCAEHADSSELYDCTLYDYTFGAPELRVEPLRLYPDRAIPGLELTPREVVRQFATPGGLALRDGLEFGEWLEKLLFAPRLSERVSRPSNLYDLWRAAVARAGDGASARPLKLQISFKYRNSQEEERSSGLLEQLPFELLARDGGFLFRRVGWTLVRTFRGMQARECELDERSGLGLLWANPADRPDEQRLSQKLFDRHEDVVRRAGAALARRSVEPVRYATRESLRQLAARHRESREPVDVLTIVAHGSPGWLLLHKHGHAAYPNDPGEPLSAAELAEELAACGVKVALLWSCHAAQGHELLGSVAQQLLDRGGVVAVVGAHAALRADTTPDLAQRIFEEVTTAGGELDRAVGLVVRGAPREDRL